MFYCQCNRLHREMSKLFKIIVFGIMVLLGFCSAATAGVASPEQPAVLRGVTFNPQHPYDLEFLVDPGCGKTVSKEEVAQLVRYFLAGLTIPREKLWVNLSPDEPSRIIDNDAVQTELGEVFLEQDYQLKQFAAELTNPESETGKAYWREINNPNRSLSEPRPSIRPANGRNTQGAARIETTQSLQKIWIMPDKAKIQENGNGAFIDEATLKVMMDDDSYAGRFDTSRSLSAQRIETNGTLSDRPRQPFKSQILPLVENEINTGEKFSRLRQAYNSLILSIWFKQKISGYLYGQYFDQVKISGINLADPKGKEKVYGRYLCSFENGVYNSVKTNYDPLRHKLIKRKYYSGGIVIPDNWRLQVVRKEALPSGQKVRVHLNVVNNSALAGAYRALPVEKKEEDMASALAGLNTLLKTQSAPFYLRRFRDDLFGGENRAFLDGIIAGKPVGKLLFLEIDAVGCDSFCVWCCGGSRNKLWKMSKKRLTNGQLIKFFDDIAAQGFKPMIRWAGLAGETFPKDPVLRTEKLAVIEHVGELGFRQVIFTSGRYLSEDTWDVLAKYVSVINISLDSPDDATNQKLKLGEGAGVWNQKIENIRGLIEKKRNMPQGKLKKTDVSYIMHPDNIAAFDPAYGAANFFAQMKALGVDECILKVAHNDPKARLSPEQVAQAYRAIESSREKFADNNFHISTLQDEAQAANKMEHDETPNFRKCYLSYWRAILALDVSTDKHCLLPCGHYIGRKIGNMGSIEDKDFASLWMRGKHLRILNRDPRVFCKQCAPTDLYFNRLLNFLAAIYKGDKGLYGKIVTAILDGKENEVEKISADHLGGIDFRLIGPAVGSKITGFSHFKQDFTGFEVDAISIDNV